MLNDTARKIYNVIFHLYRYEWSEIDIERISRLSLRTEQQVKDAVNWLFKESYIHWDKQTNRFRIPFK